jgi:hypothetical protein
MMLLQRREYIDELSRIDRKKYTQCEARHNGGPLSLAQSALNPIGKDRCPNRCDKMLRLDP